ncbi:MAG: hypothetical protein ACYS8Z_03555 [Planctomycetota bacterium]|jgi:hypothetical protein
MSDLERRIEALEKANRSWRYAAVLLGSVLLIALVSGGKPADEAPDLLQAKRIEVLAPDGKPRIVLEAHDNRSALSIVAQGKGGQRAIGFGADEEGVGMMFMKHKEYPLLRFDGNDDGCMLAMFDGREPSQEPRGILLRTQRPTEGGLAGTVVALTRGSSKVDTRAGMFITEPTETVEQTYLQLAGSEGKTATVRVNQENGKLEVFGEGNKVMWTTP